MSLSVVNNKSLPEADSHGEAMHELAGELYPICRSITGDGVRQSLEIISQHIPLSVSEVPSGVQVFDWTIPKEWNIKDGWVKDASGQRVIDFKQNNLHVVNYSRPIRGRMSLDELRSHLHVLPEHPDWIPYRTTYYKEDWGFCLSLNQLEALPEGEYEVCIESTLIDGHLTYGELCLEGQSEEEVLLSCHVCHPSLANDNLSGVVLATALGEYLRERPRRFTYRILFIPGTIGSIAWLARNHATARLIRHGLVVACVGDAGPMTYKKSRRGDAEIDRAVEYVLMKAGDPYRIIDFTPYGYDERQYCSLGFNMPVGSLTRTPHGEYPEYHTSADNLGLISPEALQDSFVKYTQVIDLIEGNRAYVNVQPYCEPQLGRRGLYRAMGGQKDSSEREMAMLWLLNMSDGRKSLLDIAMHSKIAFGTLRDVAETLVKHELLEVVQ